MDRLQGRETQTDRQTDVQSTNYSETDEGGTDKRHTQIESRTQTQTALFQLQSRC